MTGSIVLRKEHRLAGQGAIFLCAVLWSTSGLSIKLVDWHPMVIAGSRSLPAAVFLLALRSLSPGRQSLINKKTPALIAYGLCYAVTMISFVIANKLTSSANAIMLQYTAPVWAALIGWLLLREKPHWEHWCAMVLVGIGMYLVFAGGLTGGSPAGDLFALLSGIAFAGNSVVLRMNKDGSPADILFFSLILCTVISLPFFFLYPPTLNSANLLCMAFMGFLQIGAASALFAYGIKRVSAVQAMLISAIEPVLNPVWVLAVTGEKPALSVIAGGSVIISAVVFSSVIQSTLRRRS